MSGLDKAMGRIGRWIAFLASPTGLIIAGVCVLAILALGWRSGCTQAREARQAQRQAEARTDSAIVAIEEISALEDRGQATDAEVEQAHEAIRSTPAGEQRNRRARYELCRLHDRPDCDRLLGTGPVGSDG